ncbi:MAG TPA: hypothetical protein VGS57_11970 [Thermoanaerobaculia bacterium]|jgi:hypothetical protein|nr:hypothetical protein [Thermoanaerobaculia bacterium]
MATFPGFSAGREKAARRSPVPSAHRRHRILGLRCAVGVLLTAGFIPSLRAAEVEMPGLPTDSTERAWYTAFMTRFNARVVPSLRIDPELEAKVARVWEGMVSRLTGGKGAHPTPLDQYPLLSFVDDRFLVMKIKDPRGKDTYVVRADDGGQVPTLSSTLAAYLDDAIYPSLRSIAEEERQKIVEHPDYQPSLQQLAAQNPFQHGLPIRVPEMGPFKNRVVAFTGIGGRLSAAETADYDQRKWQEASGRKVVGVVRNQQWGVAVELADLVERGNTVCRYRFVREVAAVKDEFVGEGRRGVLLRQPRLGSLLEISGCLGGCEDAAHWTRIYPEPEKGPVAPSPLLRQPLMPEVGDPSAAPIGGPGPVIASGWPG